MKVYFVEMGCYENRGVNGIYATVELAMAASPGMKWSRTIFTAFPNWPDVSVITHWEEWSNDLDWDDYCCIRAIELVEDGPRRQADITEVQELNKQGGWDYRAISDEEADALCR